MSKRTSLSAESESDSKLGYLILAHPSVFKFAPLSWILSCLRRYLSDSVGHLQDVRLHDASESDGSLRLVARGTLLTFCGTRPECYVVAVSGVIEKKARRTLIGA